MRRTCIALLSALALAACGGKSSPDTTPADGAGDGHADHTHESTGATEAPPADTGETQAPPSDGAAEPDAAQAKADLLAAETKAFEQAKPVFEKYCAKCHSKESKKASAKALDHFEMTTYPFGGHHATDIHAEIRKALAIGGGKATMPADKKGAVQGDELALIAAWADAFEKAHAGGAHEGREGHGHSDDHGDGHKH